DRDDALRRRFEQCPRQAARPRPDLDDLYAVEWACRARDAPRHIEVEDEILAEALLRDKPVPRDDLAQRRQGCVTSVASLRIVPPFALCQAVVPWAFSPRT